MAETALERSKALQGPWRRQGLKGPTNGGRHETDGNDDCRDTAGTPVPSPGTARSRWEDDDFKPGQSRCAAVCGRWSRLCGLVADAFTLSERFEEKLTQYGGNLQRAAGGSCPGLARGQSAARLEACDRADSQDMLPVGTGEVLSRQGGLVGRGGIALGARALVRQYDMSAHESRGRALEIAASIACYPRPHHRETFKEARYGTVDPREIVCEKKI